MNLTQPTPLPYDPLDWEKRSFTERARLACQGWALTGYGAPLVTYAFYVIKLLMYFGGFFAFCSVTPTLGGIGSVGSWWLEPIAFQKAILWSMLFEGLGLGCGSGPLAGHYVPPIGGVLYYLRRGTLKLPVFPGVPLLGRSERSWFDIGLYLVLLAALVRGLLAPTLGLSEFLPVALLLPLLGLSDRTLFLCFRGEHYWTTVMCFVLAPNWIAGAKAVQLALWFWAGFSKLNHHFPAVVCVMTSNHPFLRSTWLHKQMYRNYPDDLRPSRLAQLVAHGGILLELGVPLVLAFATGGWQLTLGLVMMLFLHAFITSNVPMGVPIEWNFMVVYGSFALFWAHPDVSAFHTGSPVLSIFLLVMLVAVPLIGNLFPERVSFLMAMRYYAGNWAMSVWQFRGQSSQKLQRLTRASEVGTKQLEATTDHAGILAIIGRTIAFRMMHLHGRALPHLLPKAVDRIEDYEYIEGELIAGLALGWNFGDGHLHGEQLLRGIQERCGFEPGELRVVCVESQPLGRSTLGYKILDAATGVMETGTLDIDVLREQQPWEADARPSLAPQARPPAVIPQA